MSVMVILLMGNEYFMPALFPLPDIRMKERIDNRQF